MKLSVSSYSYQQYIRAGKMTQLDVVQKAAEMGFDGIDYIDLSPFENATHSDRLAYAKQIRAAADAAGIEIVAYTVGANLYQGSPDADAAEVVRLKEQLDVAAVLGARIMRHDVCGKEKIGDRVISFERMLPTIAENVNDLLLELLLAFDECQKLENEARAEALLKAAQRLNEWTLAQDKFNAIYQLNRLQIVKRQRALNPEEEALALEIFDAACDSIAHLTRIVASALLDDKARVRKCWRDLSPAEKRDFRGWPISRFVDVKELPLEVDDAETN